MDWITTSGRTLDEAKSNALDQLGIVADEAEFDVVNDVEKGLFGRIKTEAKVRARVRPRQPAAKDERRSRNGGNRNRSRQRKRGGGGKGGNNNGDNAKNASKSSGGSNGQGDSKGGSSQNNRSNAGKGDGGRSSSKQNKAKSNQNGRRNDGNGQKSSGKAAAATAGAAAVGSEKISGKKDMMEATVSREEQEEVAIGFLEGVLTTFEMTGSVALTEEPADDGAIELAVSGDELGLLVGPKGNTLNALQELTRTVVQRNAEGAKTDRLRVDVAGYRVRRTAALRDFAQKLATEVADSGSEKLLEPMSAADRKVVHDAITDVDGVETGSEGQEPRRRVVIRPTS